jgi:hypothetical protein
MKLMQTYHFLPECFALLDPFPKSCRQTGILLLTLMLAQNQMTETIFSPESL